MREAELQPLEEEEQGLLGEEESVSSTESQQQPQEHPMTEKLKQMSFAPAMKDSGITGVCTLQEPSATGGAARQNTARVPRRLKRLANGRKSHVSLSSEEFQPSRVSNEAPLFVTSQESQVSNASHKSLPPQKDIAFKIGNEIVLRHKGVALRALVV